MVFCIIFSTTCIPASETFSKSGDNGSSKTLAGDTLPKDNKVFDAIGAAEELLSYIGFVEGMSYRKSFRSN